MSDVFDLVRKQVVPDLLTELPLGRKRERMEKMEGTSLGIAHAAALFFGIENPR